MQYTNAQFRSILNGLGHKQKTVADGSAFPVSNDNSSMRDALTIEAIKRFQREYNLKDDGIAGRITMDKAEQVIRILQDELNKCANTGLPKNQPFYGPLTTAAVKKFQAKVGWPQNGVANHELRVLLYTLVQDGSCAA